MIGFDDRKSGKGNGPYRFIFYCWLVISLNFLVSLYIFIELTHSVTP